MNIFILVLILNIIFVESNRAPDVSIDLPKNFCKYGKRTRTTGECICLSGLCEGSGCQHGDLVFFHADCTDCHCLPSSPKPKQEKAAASILDDGRGGEKEIGIQEHNEKEKILHSDENSAQEEARLDHELFMEDLYRYTGAGVVSIIFFMFIVIQIKNLWRRAYNTSAITIEKHSSNQDDLKAS